MAAANPSNKGGSNPLGRGHLQAILVPSFMSSIMLMLLVLANMSYLYGTTFRQQSRVHALKMLVVDFDQGEIGSAFIQASEQLQGNHFPTVELGSVSRYPDSAAVKRSVCKADYWAALYIEKGASAALASAANGSSSQYNPASVSTYIYNQARYPVVGDSYLINGLTSIIAASRTIYYNTPKGNATLASLPLSNSNAIAAYLNPIGSTPDLIQPTTQVNRVFFNTVNLVIPPLAQFFFILALNGIAMGSGFHSQASVKQVWLLRFCIGKVYTFLSGLVMAGYIWAFKETWGVSGADFAQSWMLFWFLMDIQFQVMESVIGSYLPIQFTPFFVFTWIITNVASTVFPFEIMPGWYRVGYALPSREAYSLMVQIWSGCGDQNRIALPVLFSWWILGHIGAVFSVRKRCSDAKRFSTDTASETTVLDTATGTENTDEAAKST